ncbi:hypothetical protein [Streptomyces atratus]|uniref:hypothetical protein n=1 Tax=Streptomyces atratus TaxID=1893 RepID=UPI0037915AA9
MAEHRRRAPSPSTVTELAAGLIRAGPGMSLTGPGARSASAPEVAASSRKSVQPFAGAWPTSSVPSFASATGSCASSQSASCRKDTQRTPSLVQTAAMVCSTARMYVPPFQDSK